MLDPLKYNHSNLYKINLNDNRIKENTNKINLLISEILEKNFTYKYMDVIIFFDNFIIELKNIHKYNKEIFIIKDDDKTQINIYEFINIFEKNKNKIDHVKYNYLNEFHYLKETINKNKYNQLNLIFDNIELIEIKKDDKYFFYQIKNNNLINISNDVFFNHLKNIFRSNNIVIFNKKENRYNRKYLKDFYIN